MLPPEVTDMTLRTGYGLHRAYPWTGAEHNVCGDPRKGMLVTPARLHSAFFYSISSECFYGYPLSLP